ncbi:2Fe-2S iron-sulfur cluster-binding protein [Flavobacteriaceae bacterium]|nr:2Fe-2S iron-sulfur cluster-binding protein [Flavobacteriaceae bacterium]
MSEMYPLQVVEVQRLTDDAVAISFAIPKDLTQPFSFQSGQFLTLSQTIDDKDVRRSYSICSAPHEELLRVGIKAIPNGLFSNYANRNIQVGDTLKVGVPQGRFTFIPNQNKNLLLLAAGSGITPIMSIAKTALKETESNLVLVYGNRSEDDTMFFDELQQLKSTYENRLSVVNIYSRKKVSDALFGRIDMSHINYVRNTLFSQLNFDTFYVCGPSGMIEASVQALSDSGVSDENIHVEHFTGGAEIDRSVEGKIAYEVLLDDETHPFSADASKTILEAAIDAGIEPPYSCQGGVCGSCIGRIKEGEVSMASNQILSDSEVEEGLVLTCQASCTSKHIVVDFDRV